MGFSKEYVAGLRWLFVIERATIYNNSIKCYNIGHGATR